MKLSATDVLKEVFGYDSFRDQQEKIIESVISGQDTLVIMPTGGGKSLCYQIPALLLDGLTIVVSPLIALMNDQVAALQQLNISAAALHSNIDYDDKRRIDQKIMDGSLKLLYVSPEGLLQERFLEYLQRQKVSLIAIDEAHCVSVWGNDFRPEYVKLAALKQYFPQVPTIALTATADHATQTDIMQQLAMKEANHFLSSFERTNINTAASPGQKRIEQISNFLSNKSGQAGIVYCLSRKSTEKIADDLQAMGYKARAYHAGVEPHLREEIQREFQNDDIQIVCATIAFGMGIDKPNIRWVIHYNMPKNIEGYYQEIGRAGRDASDSETLLFYSWGDYTNLMRFIDESEASDSFKNVQRAKLERMWEFSTAASCRTNLVLNYFGEYRSDNCGHCDNCINPPEMFDGIRYAQMALSAVIRANERLGINLLIDVLRGSYRQEIREAGLDKIKTYGVGRDIPFLHWKHYVTQIINQGLISIDYTDGSRLKRTPLSESVLKAEIEVPMTKFVSEKEKAKFKVPKPVINMEDTDASLLSKLKSWRSKQAKSQGVPAFVILHDRALVQIATLKPISSPQLLAVEGIGKAKNEKYGEDIIEIVSASL